MKDRKCKVCSNQVQGRKGKLFCGIKCKNYYHTNLRRVTKDASVDIDRILHRNRAILLEIIGKKRREIKVARMLLDRKNFNFTFGTHSYQNSKGKIYQFVYDFAWMEFTDQDILIVRASKKHLVKLYQ